MAYAFSDKSARRIATLDPRLRDLVTRAAEYQNIAVIEGHRSTERQKRLFMAGRSRIDGVSRQSKHNHEPSLAVDMAPYPIDFDDTERFRRFGYYVLGLASALGIKVRWGGDWDGDGDVGDQTFNDLLHFELVD